MTVSLTSDIKAFLQLYKPTEEELHQNADEPPMKKRSSPTGGLSAFVNPTLTGFLTLKQETHYELPARFGTEWHGAARLGSARLGTTRLGSVGNPFGQQGTAPDRSDFAQKAPIVMGSSSKEKLFTVAAACAKEEERE
ncbi:hypothetical protein ANN_04702 [Periplaneta americana]|uniref:Uncharacterized protein n=1 Tax=Periplaneta americana TaxID=6978 RepID=A0ABQ8T948_PERAM|nr:hypothetical protein ANN_04702 [Periplaneta americana]